MKGVLRQDDMESQPFPEVDAMMREVAEHFGLSYEKGPITFCSACGFIECACDIIAKHTKECRYRIAATMPIGLPCDHGFNICPGCDPCTCAPGS